MTFLRCRPVVCGALLVAALLALSGCGKKGPPRAPLRIVPVAAGNLVARRTGPDVFVEFTVPAANSDGTSPADLVQVEVYGLTAEPLPAGVRPLTEDEFLEVATLVASIDIRPPPEPEAEGQTPTGDPAAPAPPPPPEPEIDLPGQGEVVTVLERLTAEAMAPVDLSELREELEVDPEEEDEPETDSARRWIGPLVPPVVAPPLRRLYVAVGVAADGDPGLLTPRVPILLVDPPQPPAAPDVTYTESAVTVQWGPAPGARRRVQEPAGLDVLPVLPLLDWPVPTLYNVYEAPPDDDRQAAMPRPINPAPLEALVLPDPRVAFGTQRCYAVRAVDTHDLLQVESVASAVTCVDFVDTFPPAPPQALAAVGSANAISLIWSPNLEPDLAGYRVLRGVGGAPLEPLTLDLVEDTTYRDVDVEPGVAYVYAVVAVDNAPSPNTSDPSAPVREEAR